MVKERKKSELEVLLSIDQILGGPEALAERHPTIHIHNTPRHISPYASHPSPKHMASTCYRSTSTTTTSCVPGCTIGTTRTSLAPGTCGPKALRSGRHTPIAP